LLIVAWLLSWATLASAQSQFPPLDGVVADDTQSLNAATVNDAAADLQELGVKPLAVFVSENIGPNDITDYARRAAQNYRLSNSDILDPNLLGVVVSLGGRQATILYGEGLKGAMTQQRGGRPIHQILREDYLNPKLAGGDFTGAFADTFRQAAREIDLFRNPPAAATPRAPVTIDTGGIGDALIWIVGGLVILGALMVAVPVVYRRWKKSQETAARRRVLQDQLVQARNVTADMITNLEFPVDPNEQITYRFLALTLERERPQQLAEIRAKYDSMYDRVAEALARYDAANKGTYTTEQEMTSAIAQYQGVQMEIKAASEFLQGLADQSEQLEEQTRAAPGEVDAAKKALAAAADEIQKLAAAAPDLHPIDAKAARTLAHARARLSQAESALAAKPPLFLQAYDSARSARSLAEQMSAAIKQLSSTYSSLAQHKGELEEARSKGFKLVESDRLFAETLSGLSAAAQKLEVADIAGFTEALQSASALVSRAEHAVRDEIALQAANGQALDRLKADGEAIKTLIQQGAQAFDKVDEYAESSWLDIRGNGTEAQTAADDAYGLWTEASALNAVSPESPQDFVQAREKVDEANRLLEKARTLIAAIFDRLKHLEESKRIAADEIEAARRDIAAGHSFISQHDQDISPSPDNMLTEAEKSLRLAQEEMGRPKPDWISVVAQARKANDLADKSLANARSEAEAMQARRQKARTTAQQAEASLSRAANFASVHHADLDTSVIAGIKAAQESMERAQGALAQAESEGREDLARAEALDKAAEYFKVAQQAADAAYEAASSQFTAREALRREAYEELQSAEASIRSAAAFMQAHDGVISAQSVGALQAAIDAMPAWRDGADPAYLQGISKAAKQVERKAAAAQDTAEAEVRAHSERQNADEMQDLLGTLLTIGAATVLSGGGRRRDPGWGRSSGGGIGGIFGGSSGSGGGGGGSSSGGWGGGGSDSGSWGGGGSSSGSWGGGGSSSGGW
jgi:uncharacterized membrane protein YgcG